MNRIEALLEVIHVCEENPRLVRALEDLLIEDSPLRIVEESERMFAQAKEAMDKAAQEETDPVKEEPKEEPKPKKKRGGRKTSVDVGRIKALRTGGWTIAEIADDVKCSQQMVRNNLAKLGMK